MFNKKSIYSFVAIIALSLLVGTATAFAEHSCNCSKTGNCTCEGECDCDDCNCASDCKCDDCKCGSDCGCSEE